MKKKAIKNAVEAAKEAHLPGAIDAEARRLAEDEVWRALHAPPKEQEKPKNVLIDPHDPRICGTQ